MQPKTEVEEAYEAEYESLVRISRSVLGEFGANYADDNVQATWLIWLSRPRDEVEGPAAYRRVTAFNNGLRLKRMLSIGPLSIEEPESGLPRVRPPADEDPEAVAELMTLFECVERLEGVLKDILLARFVSEISSKVLAAQHDVGERTISNWANKAIQAVFACMEANHE